MIDVKHLAENPDLYRASQRAREDDESLVDQIITADADRRAALQARATGIDSGVAQL